MRRLRSIKSNDVQLSVQWLHALLYAGAVFCTLWLRGESNLMFGVMLAAPCMVLFSRISMKVLPPVMRQLVQLAIGALAFVWVKIRFEEMPWDVLLFEGMVILALALFVGRRPREYGMLLFCCCCMLGYGGLRPSRAGFLPVFFMSLAAVALILYMTRTSLLVSMKAREHGMTFPLLRGSWTYRAVHFAAAFVLMFVFMHILPYKQALWRRGFIPVSFNNDYELMFERFWDRFRRDGQALQDDGGEQPRDSDKLSNPVNSRDAKNMADMGNVPSFDSRNGNGSGSTIGTDLVFRAYTPAKLYWVVQMYDTYDGTKWTQSEAMKSGRCLADRIRARQGTLVPQHIVLEKPVGEWLPYAFRFEQGRFRDVSADTKHTALLYLHDNINLGVRVIEKPDMPWSYFVMSYVPSQGWGGEMDTFHAFIRNYGVNYRLLPIDVISDRTMELARKITAGAADEYEKACRIRDHLRTSYKYDLQCPTIPQDRETVDFFLFDSKSGYCQHFAQAFCVLARAAGLYSRLVTGYSPGNYNLLSNCFEVYEYHGHAWVQIFVPRYGWLTFDGVAPGALNLESTPKALSTLLEPFGAEWNSKPPELSVVRPPSKTKSDVMKSSKVAAAKKTTAEEKETKPDLMDAIFRVASREGRTMQPDIFQLARAAGKVFFARTMLAISEQWTAFREWFADFASRLSDMFKRLSWSLWAGLITLVAVVAALLVFRRRITGFLSFHWTKYRLLNQWRQDTQTGASARRKVLACHHLASRMLDLTRLQHVVSEDLLERAERLKDEAPNVAAEYHVVAVAAEQAYFAPGMPDAETVDDTMTATRHFLSAIQPYLKISR